MFVLDKNIIENIFQKYFMKSLSFIDNNPILITSRMHSNSILNKMNSCGRKNCIVAFELVFLVLVLASKSPCQPFSLELVSVLLTF